MRGNAALSAAWAAAAVGTAYALVSLYWALGGTALLDTVGGSLAEQGRHGGAAIATVIWAAVALKAVAVALPLLAVRRRGPAGRRALARRLSWLEAAVLICYGLVLTAAGVLVQADIVHAAADADHRALAWHTYLWDPWFLLWGLLVFTALRFRTAGARPRR